MRRIWGVFASTWLTIVLAVIICAVSAWGSIVTVNNPEFFRALDSRILLPWLAGPGREYMDLTLWVYLLIAFMVLFTVNTVVCTIDKVYSILANRLPWRALFPHIVHVGFLIALVGHLLSSTTGFRSYGTVVLEGDSAPVEEVAGLSVRLEGVDTETRPDGELSMLKTRVSILEGDRVVKSGSIEINGPLIYKGVAFYHLDQGSTPTGLVLTIDGERADAYMERGFTAGGVEYRIAGIYPDFARTPDGGGYSRSGEYRNPYVEIVSRAGDRAFLDVSRPGTAAESTGGRTIVLEDFLMSSYAVLAIHRDPGIWPIIIGSSVLVVGMVLLLFMRGSRGELMRPGAGGADMAGGGQAR